MNVTLHPNFYLLQTLEVIVRSVRSINTMAGIRRYAIGVGCSVEDHTDVVNALGVETIEVGYIYTKGTKRNGKN